MQNQYIVDAFLSGTLWAVIAYLFFDSRARVKILANFMDASLLTAALSQVAKKATITAAPFCLFLIFLLWRFYGLMVASQTWGAGGAGLLATLFAIGSALIWLQVVLVFVNHSGFLPLAKKVGQGKQSEAIKGY